MSVLKGYKGKWKVDITDGIDPLTGEIKRHRKSGFTSRKEAVQYEADYRLNKLHQVQIKDKISVSHLYSLVQQEDELRGNKRGTIDTQISYYNQYVSKFFYFMDSNGRHICMLKKLRDILVGKTTKC